jgi:CheY-like chemotaxis protein
MRHLRVLVCDHEPQSLRALRVVLHGAGFEVDGTRTAAAALGCAALSVPAAAIVELVLPDGDGLEVCRRLREWTAMPVILLSAVCDDEEQVRAFDAGADWMTSKRPFNKSYAVGRSCSRSASHEGACCTCRQQGLGFLIGSQAGHRDQVPKEPRVTERRAAPRQVPASRAVPARHSLMRTSSSPGESLTTFQGQAVDHKKFKELLEGGGGLEPAVADAGASVTSDDRRGSLVHCPQREVHVWLGVLRCERRPSPARLTSHFGHRRRQA